MRESEHPTIVADGACPFSRFLRVAKHCRGFIDFPSINRLLPPMSFLSAIRESAKAESLLMT